MKVLLCFTVLIVLLACGKTDGWPPPTSFSAVLMNSDSTSIVTSEQDKLTIHYKEGDMMRQLYDLKIDTNRAYYTFSSMSAFGHINNPLYIECKGKIDTLIFIQTPSYEDEPLEATFNGKRIYIPKYTGPMYLVR